MKTLWQKYCKGKGIEIGGSIHNSFGLDTINVDWNNKFYTDWQIKNHGEAMPVDIEADAHSIPVPDRSYDFIISSHVFEHLDDPISALMEWDRIIRPGGVIFMIIPHKDRTFDKDKERTTLSHLIDDYKTATNHSPEGHKHFWITADVVELVNYMIQNVGMKWELVEVEDKDSKVGNGFTIVIRKDEDAL